MGMDGYGWRAEEMEMEIETERDNERKSGRETDRGGGSVKKEK